jgi:hypothetical protein
MSASLEWSDSIAKELGPLLELVESTEELDVDDAARVLVLMARAEQLGPPEPLRPLLLRGSPSISRLAALAPLSEAEPLLLELDTAFQVGEDPHGVLHDLLLELDDWLSVAVFLESHGVPPPASANATARGHVARFAAARITLSPEQVAPLAGWALSRVWSLEPARRKSGGEPYALVAAPWQAVVDAVLSEVAEALPVAQPPAESAVDAIVRALVPTPSVARRPEPPGSRVRRLLEAISLATVLPRAALASSGIDLGPEPVELHRWGEAVLELTLGPDLETPMLQVSGTEGAEEPRGTREGTPLVFSRDEFKVWLAEALPGKHHVTLRGETVEFTLTRP